MYVYTYYIIIYMYREDDFVCIHMQGEWTKAKVKKRESVKRIQMETDTHKN